MLFNDSQYIAKCTFGLSLLLLLISLYLSLREIQISIEALKIELSDLENTSVIVSRNTAGERTDSR